MYLAIRQNIQFTTIIGQFQFFYLISFRRNTSYLFYLVHRYILGGKCYNQNIIMYSINYKGKCKHLRS